MALLKLGSKGKDVETLQALLNKAKAGAVLKVDGIFGKLTDKVVRIFQKKCDLKSDGKVGESTLAAVKYGKPLPVMTTQDYALKMGRIGKVRSHHKTTARGYVALEKELAKLAQVTTREAAKASKLIQENQAKWDQLVSFGAAILAKQAEFKVYLKTAPAKAEKLVKDCENIEKQMAAIYDSQIYPNQLVANASMTVIRKAMEAAQTNYAEQLDAVKESKKSIDVL